METKHPMTRFTPNRLPADGMPQADNQLAEAASLPNNYLLLDGEWRFTLDPYDRGLHDLWCINHPSDGTVQWPGSIEAHIRHVRGNMSPGKKERPVKVVIWYERDFNLPTRNGATDHSIFQLTFGACGYPTRVWLNGHLLRTLEDEDPHCGSYASFSYELPDQYLRPLNRLTVRIADVTDADIRCGEQESHVYKQGVKWYQTYTGVVQSVWLETVDRNRLRSRLGVVSVVEDRLVRFSVTTRIHDPGHYLLRLQVFDVESDQQLANSDFPLRLEAGQKQQRVVVDVDHARLWSPQSPTRYRLVAQLIDHTGYATQVETLFGLRKIEARGRYVYLNNEPVYLDGIVYRPGGATLDEMQRHMRAIKELGCNLVRVHMAGLDPRLYNLADELGLLLWVEVPAPLVSTELSRQHHKAELLRMLSLIGSHPSVVIWSLYNEDQGAQDIAANAQTRQYIMDLYHFMQLAHPQFLVVDNDGWHHISYEGRLKSDLLTAHVHTSDPDQWRTILNRLETGEFVQVANHPLVVGDPFFYRRQVPLIVSEWGGFVYNNWPTHSASYADQIRWFKQVLRQHTFAGDIYRPAIDSNGLIDPQTGALTVPAGLLESSGSQPITSKINGGEVSDLRR
ncbi:glycoside hydrolase family 2 [Spirosoma radiotolerans]|uniref:glycoside hydrolase family 2 n=1 Tax=Spirosoma radiotolerans TaxID=1379870 RepID=UPI00061D02B0|nr:glycoside hydrolase family 2 [Spirosoma radiotolerans]